MECGRLASGATLCQESGSMFRRLGIVAALIVLAFGATSGLSQPGEGAAEFDWVELGASVFGQSCAMCHGPQGAGIPGAFPPLAGHVSDLLALEGGRELVAKTVLFGLAGRIEVDGVAYDGAMPSWAQFSDEELAAVVNHVAWTLGGTAPANDRLVLPSDIAGHREAGLTSNDVWALRSTVLGLETEAPAQAPAGGVGALAVNDETGYYTAAQVESGREVYAQHCAMCHGPTMRGGLHDPALTGLAFFRKWGGQTFDALYTFISTRMPMSAPGDLSTAQYVDLAAFWLSDNKYPAGEIPLTADPRHLAQILIERR